LLLPIGGGGGGSGGLSYFTSSHISDGRQIAVKNYHNLGTTDGIVIITPIFG
jgi:hypothetical protein